MNLAVTYILYTENDAQWHELVCTAANIPAAELFGC